MKQNIWFGLRAVMLATILSSAPSTQAQQDLTLENQHGQSQAPVSAIINSEGTVTESSRNTPLQSNAAETLTAVAETEATKVGTRNLPSSAALSSEAVLAKIQAHEWSKRHAATLYLRNIPVLTFLGQPADSAEKTKVGVKVATTESGSLSSLPERSGSDRADAASPAPSTSDESGDPVSQATKVAAALNQLSLVDIQADDITIHWVGNANTSEEQYEIRVAGKPLVKLDKNIVLAGQQKQTEAFALQATNRFRRLVANAAPLTEVAGKPKPKPQATQQIALGSVRFSVNGMASWYGPGFHGNLSANGEVYNQYAMTAAHKTLPFGTRVRVTNVHNGRSVIVRINDRGPFVGNRVIDLSMGAAQVIGMMGSGVAPVRLEILN